VETPSRYGFPYTIRLPLGVVAYPPPDTMGYLHGTRVSDWEAENLPPWAISDPYGTYHTLKSALNGLLKIENSLRAIP
jgi:hypothetical protein